MKRKTTTMHREQDTKSQSEVVGVVLLLVLSMTAISIIFAFGYPSLTEANEIVSTERSDNEFSLLDARIATTALGASQIQDFTLNIDDGKLVVEPEGARINITQEYPSANESFKNRTLYEAPMGHIVHKKGNGERVAYEGGGVWRSSDNSNSSLMVSTPEFHYEGQTLTLPLFNITRDLNGSSGSGQTAIAGERSNIRVVTEDGTRRMYPISENEQKDYNTSGAPEAFGGLYTTGEVGDPDDSNVENRDNPLTNGTIFVTVESPFYEGWQSYFEQRTEGEVTEVNDSGNKVTMELDVPLEPTDIDSGGIFKDGCLHTSGPDDDCDDTFDGGYKEGVTIPSTDEYIDNVVSDARSSGETWDNNCISGECGGTHDLYYADGSTGSLVVDNDINGDEFQVDDNTVKVAIDNEGDGPVDIGEIDIDEYNESESYRLEILVTGDIEFPANSAPRNTDSMNSTKMIIYQKSDNEIEFRGNQGDDSYGVVYAPDSDVEFRGAPSWKWNGSIVANSMTNRGDPGTVEHGEDMVIKTEIEDPITFLHITENRIEVE